MLPMINVVFLLLIFFLISAKMAPPEPFAITPPEARAEAEALGDFTLYLSAEGALGFHDLISTGADDDTPLFEALIAARQEFCAFEDCDLTPARLLLRADGQAPTARLAALLPQLGQAGFASVDLVAVVGAAP
ncbi:ExbD/TolR family protein [Phaeovulum sp.]|uniref:ExbD/TolR family protein n=1 Tax=Phaeovulum sp. TaxID=2934796 RepID=UPI0039E4AB10